jgi:hypothetical protein
MAESENGEPLIYTAENAAEIPAQNFPNVFFNRFHVVVGSETTRIALGNEPVYGAPPSFTAVTVLPTSVAVDLAHAILRITNSMAPRSPNQNAE